MGLFFKYLSIKFLIFSCLNNSINSEETAGVIDEEVKKIIDNAYRNAEEILRANIDKLHAVAGVLLEKEKIEGDEFDAIMG